MERSEEETPKRFCLVCGHPMGPLDRICDKCGSIRRPAKSIGRRNPPERHSTCERCGESIPFGKRYCDQCDTFVKKHQKEQAKERGLKKGLKTFRKTIGRAFGRSG